MSVFKTFESREFIAVHSEKKHALLFALGWAFWMWFTVMLIKAN